MCHSRASPIFICFHSRDRTTLLKAFVTYVRPLLEYSSPVWSPSTITDIAKIESVQRSFTQRLPWLKNLPYSKRLDVPGIGSLELRWLLCDLTCVMKCFLVLSTWTLTTILHLEQAVQLAVMIINCFQTSRVWMSVNIFPVRELLLYRIISIDFFYRF